MNNATRSQICISLIKMFHSSHIHVPRNGRPSALRPFVTSSFGTPDHAETKEPLRRGILFTTVASVLLLVGSILTWLGFNDVFGGKVSMTGPLLIALALLLLLLSMRQFLIARKRNNSTRNGLQLGQMGRGTVTAVVVDRNNGVGAVTVVMDSHSIDQETHFRNSESSNIEDYEPPSYSEVTQCFPANTLVCNQPVVSQDEPPPPYEEAIVGDNSRSSLQTHSEESAPAYSPQGQSGYSIERGSSMVTLPGQVPGPQCYHCCMFPSQTGLESTQGGRLSSHSLTSGQVLGPQELAQSSNRAWGSPRRFVLIPHFLGIFANGPQDPAQSVTGERPPAYQAVDTTGRSPLTYVQAMGLSNPPSVSDHLGIQSPHESRPPANINPQQEPAQSGSYHPPRSKDAVSPGVVSTTSRPVTLHPNSSAVDSRHSSMPASTSLASVSTPISSSGTVFSHPSPSLPLPSTSVHGADELPTSASPSNGQDSCVHSSNRQGAPNSTNIQTNIQNAQNICAIHEGNSLGVHNPNSIQGTNSSQSVASVTNISAAIGSTSAKGTKCSANISFTQGSSSIQAQSPSCDLQGSQACHTSPSCPSQCVTDSCALLSTSRPVTASTGAMFHPNSSASMQPLLTYHTRSPLSDELEEVL